MIATDDKRISQLCLISSREKLNTIAPKILLYLYFNNKKIFDLKTLLPVLGGEMRKNLEVLFILEGIGMIFRVSKSKFIFQGLEGMVNKF